MPAEQRAHSTSISVNKGVSGMSRGRHTAPGTLHSAAGRGGGGGAGLSGGCPARARGATARHN